MDVLEAVSRKNVIFFNLLRRIVRSFSVLKSSNLATSRRINNIDLDSSAGVGIHRDWGSGEGVHRDGCVALDVHSDPSAGITISLVERDLLTDTIRVGALLSVALIVRHVDGLVKLLLSLDGGWYEGVGIKSLCDCGVRVVGE